MFFYTRKQLAKGLEGNGAFVRSVLGQKRVIDARLNGDGADGGRILAREPGLQGSGEAGHEYKFHEFVNLSREFLDQIREDVMASVTNAMNAKLRFLNNVFGTVCLLSQSQDKEIAAEAAEFGAEMARKIAKLKRTEADRVQPPKEALESAKVA